jgi:hypothetical protein
MTEFRVGELSDETVKVITIQVTKIHGSKWRLSCHDWRMVTNTDVEWFEVVNGRMQFVGHTGNVESVQEVQEVPDGGQE